MIAILAHLIEPSARSHGETCVLRSPRRAEPNAAVYPKVPSGVMMGKILSRFIRKVSFIPTGAGGSSSVWPRLLT